LARLISTKLVVKPDEAPIGKDEDILNYDDLDDPDVLRELRTKLVRSSGNKKKTNIQWELHWMIRFAGYSFGCPIPNCPVSPHRHYIISTFGFQLLYHFYQ
jgi:hypothetical protein